MKTYIFTRKMLGASKGTVITIFGDDAEFVVKDHHYNLRLLLNAGFLKPYVN